jgi:hypothetical protein
MQARRCLRPGGRIIALGPNIRYLPGKYWDFYDHYLALTELSLGEVMAETGFTLNQHRTDSPVSTLHVTALHWSRSSRVRAPIPLAMSPLPSKAV